jgi:hypothetical protein
MKQLLAAAGLADEGANVLLGEAPIVITAGGKPVTKAAVQVLIQEVGKKLGMKEPTTAHAMRVTAAHILAASGMELWRIQVFLRWGSAAVFGYMRDAPLSMSASISGQVMASMSEIQVRQEVAGALAEAGCENIGLVLSRVDEHLERRMASIVPVAGDDMVLATIAALQKDIAELMVAGRREARIQYIRNDAPSSGILHIVKDDVMTVCGWRYGESGLASASDKSAKSKMCRQCKVIV